MLVYRVFPHLPGASPDQPGHPLYIHPDQGLGRWDNPGLYRSTYVAATPSGAVGEAFAGLPTWSKGMLLFPSVAGSSRALAVYALDEEAYPLLDLDDACMLVERGLRPTDVVIRNRPRTQEIARQAHGEGRWAGLSWWSMHRPQWTLYVLWKEGSLTVEGVEPLPAHPALLDAGQLLAKHVAHDMR